MQSPHVASWVYVTESSLLSLKDDHILALEVAAEFYLHRNQDVRFSTKKKKSMCGCIWLIAGIRRKEE